MSIKVKDLVKRYNGRVTIDHISFEIDHGELVSLLGPSGCGKTTTLRCIAGLEIPEEGRIEIDGQVVFESATGVMVEPYHRSIGMVFQSYAIWPHLSVFQNVAFPLQVRRRPARRSGAPYNAGARDGGFGQPARPFVAAAFRRPAAAHRGGARDRALAGGYSCLTSRCPTWTPSCATARGRRFAVSSANSKWPRSTSPTTRQRRCRCPIASW